MQAADGSFDPAGRARAARPRHRRDRPPERSRQSARRRGGDPHRAAARGLRQRRPALVDRQHPPGHSRRCSTRRRCTGLVAPNGTQFPVPIGLASAWDPAMVERVMSIAAVEARAAGRAARARAGRRSAGATRAGGRIEEYLRGRSVARRAPGRGRGARLQGRILPLAKDKVFATPEHFTGTVRMKAHQHGAGARPRAAAAQRTARPFQAAITEAGAYSVMPSYNEGGAACRRTPTAGCSRTCSA
jgi:beta-glucosidase